ncbi:site-specific integrase [Spirosoma endbachense]|uniref:Tyrosine-type recombinase/integrase n=1 Tax=Spirosoma endbachense TaxID=2666025 RepID=A0A6P1VXT9_9BACT|nr:site-specific integrase [Spirosoma endbachense]QHV97933.1 tyrosine-type recombinase/integrase [Spirosoma endbachense]
MKTSIKVIIKDDYIKKDGTCPLYLQVFIEKKMTRFPLNINWPPDYFDKTSGKLKPRSNPDKEFNDYQLIINSQVGRVNEIFLHYRLSKKELSVDQLKKDFYNWRTKQDFLVFWANELEDRRKRKKIEESTYSSQKAALSKLKQYKESLTFNELTPKLIENWKAWMKSKLKNSPNTIEKNVKDLRTYVNLAIQDGIVMDNPFKVVKVRQFETLPEVLTIEQVEKLIELYEDQETPDNWRRVLQHFLFSCFTGLRISDIQRVRAENIQDGCLVIVPHKTRNKKIKPVTIPLHDVALSFIEKTAGKLFQTFSEQHSRDLLKDIARHMEWNISPGTHTARHTFGTNFIELGGDVITLKNYMGHSKIQTTMQYVHISENRKKEQINVFDRFRRPSKKSKQSLENTAQEGDENQI